MEAAVERTGGPDLHNAGFPASGQYSVDHIFYLVGTASSRIDNPGSIEVFCLDGRPLARLCKPSVPGNTCLRAGGEKFVMLDRSSFAGILPDGSVWEIKENSWSERSNRLVLISVSITTAREGDDERISCHGLRPIG